ncbi:MAG: DEAD/DEAH box helicase [Lentisphaeraceae bacterium]|nr:DEAD/DEAH box helicase [Lentisphaeraceae bacterium]
MLRGISTYPRDLFDKLVSAATPLLGDSTLVNSSYISHLSFILTQDSEDTVLKLLEDEFPKSEQSTAYQEHLIFLRILSKRNYKKALATYCKHYKLRPETLIVRLFYKYLSQETLDCLPIEISSLLGRYELEKNFFEPGIHPGVLNYLSQSKSSDLTVYAKFILGEEITASETLTSRIVRHWQKKEFLEVISLLESIPKLISKNKISRNRVSYFLIMLHILSLIREEKTAEARELLSTYKNFKGIHTVIRVLDICLDYHSGKISKTKTKLKQLAFGMQGVRSESFFKNLAYFWLNDSCTKSEIYNLKELREEYLVSKNKFMFREVDHLFRKVSEFDIDEPNTAPSFSTLFDCSEDWQSLLESIRDVKLPQKLIWLVRLDPGDGFQDSWCEIEPALADVKTKNKLGKPVFVSWDDLLRNSEVELSRQDRKVLSLLRETGEDEKINFKLDEKRALYELSLAENVFLMDEPTQKVLLRQKNAEIDVLPEKNKYKISWKYPENQGGFLIKETGDFSYDVCWLSSLNNQIKEKIGKGILAPLDKESFKDFCDSLDENIIVRGSDIFESKDEEREEQKLVCRFNPSGEEYRLEVLVKSSWGLYDFPGKGKSQLIQKIQGKTHVWERDRALEKKLFVQLQESIDLEDDFGLGNEVEIHDRQHLLEILDRVQEFPFVTIEWPKELKVTAHKYSTGILSVKASEHKNWFHIEGKMAFGDKVIELSKLLNKLKKSSRFIEVSDNQYLLLTEELRTQLEDLSQLVDQRDEQLLLHCSLAEQFNAKLNGVPVDLEEDILFKDAITRALHSKKIKVEKPSNLLADLRPYQKVGFEWMSKMLAQDIGVCLADDMGLGKTVQTLSVICEQAKTGPVLVVAPTSLCVNWCEEGQKFTEGLTFVNYSGNDRQDKLKLVQENHVFIVSYSTLTQDSEYLSEFIWSCMVLDEAQMIKNTNTLRSKSIRLIQSRAKIALSGTPLENHVGELWNILDIVNPGLLGNRSSFQKNFALPIEKGDEDAIKKLKSRIKPFVLRRLRRQVLDDLPESQESTIYIELSDDERNLYDAHRHSALKQLKKYRNKNQPKKKIEILAEITRLRIAAANPQISPQFPANSAKSNALLEKLQSLKENDHKTLIFSQFVGHLDVIQNLLESSNISFSRLDGSMNQAKRQKAIESFSNGHASCMLISLKAGGVGLNLTEADHVIHMDPWWNPAVEDQAAARAVRIGQKNKVNIIRFISKGTIEEDILKLHDSKRSMADNLLKGTNQASKMSIEELLSLIDKK